MSRSEREHLLNLYTRATGALSERVAEVARTADCSDSHTFDSAWHACEEAHHLVTDIQQRIYQYLVDRCAAENTAEQPSGTESIETRVSPADPPNHGAPATSP